MEEITIFVGIDLVEIDRIHSILRKHPRFLERILSSQEYQQLSLRNFKEESVAANFCAKEAFLKALGIGISKIRLRDVQILRNGAGVPYIFFGKNSYLNKKYGNVSFKISITHTKKYAAAVVVGCL